jgi:hypothetical protein
MRSSSNTASPTGIVTTSSITASSGSGGAAAGGTHSATSSSLNGSSTASDKHLRRTRYSRQRIAYYDLFQLFNLAASRQHVLL